MDNTKVEKTFMREYCKQTYANKLQNLEEMDRSQDTQNLMRLKHEEADNLN